MAGVKGMAAVSGMLGNIETASFPSLIQLLDF